MTLKVQKDVVGDHSVVFSLSGRIQGGDLAELRRLFDLEPDDLRIVLDMTDVRLVDRSAIAFLTRCEAEGITLRHCPAYIHKWIEGERNPK
jgi:hypothetical protein